MSNFTSKEIVQELVESTRDNRWFVNTKTIGTQVGHRNFPPLTVQRHVTEAVKRLSAKQKKIAAMDGDKDEIDADDLAKLRSMKENNDSHTHAAHFNNSKGEWSGMALIDAKDDDDAIAQAHQISAGNKWKDFKLSGVERHVPVKEEVEQVDEISTKTASNYADKAWSSGDDKRAKGLNLAIRKMASKGAKVSTTMEDNKKPNYNTFAGVTYRPPNTSKDRRDPKDHKHEYDLARRVDNPLRKKVEEEVEQVDEGAGYGIGSVVKLHKPIDGHEYGHVMGITGSKVTHGPTGRGSPMPAGKATSIHLQLKKTPNYTADYGGKVEVPLSAIHSKIREEVEQVNELKKSTLASYIKKAAIQRTHAASQAGVEFGIGVGSDAYKSDSKYIAKQNQKVGKRTLGMDKAVNKLAKEEVETEEVTYIEERLSKNDPPSQWIQDFVKSDNPKFAGKSKKDRINMALGAFYSKKRQK